MLSVALSLSPVASGEDDDHEEEEEEHRHGRAGLGGVYQLSGIYAALGWQFADHWITAARAEWSSGNRMAGLERRWRLAANIGRTSDFPSTGDAHVRLQYTYDKLGGYGEDHAIWLQCVLNLGAAHHGHQH